MMKNRHIKLGAQCRVSGHRRWPPPKREIIMISKRIIQTAFHGWERGDSKCQDATIKQPPKHTTTLDMSEMKTEKTTWSITESWIKWEYLGSTGFGSSGRGRLGFSRSLECLEPFGTAFPHSQAWLIKKLQSLLSSEEQGKTVKRRLGERGAQTTQTLEI